MFACKYNGGVSSKRIINAFEFLKKRSDEAAVAAQREAAELRRKAQKPPAVAGGEEYDKNMPDEEDAEDLSGEPSELLRRRRARLTNIDQAKNDFPKGGAGLVSLMGDLSSLETRIQGSWNLVIKAGGRCFLFALGLCSCSGGAVDLSLLARAGSGVVNFDVPGGE